MASGLLFRLPWPHTFSGLGTGVGQVSHCVPGGWVVDCQGREDELEEFCYMSELFRWVHTPHAVITAWDRVC